MKEEIEKFILDNYKRARDFGVIYAAKNVTEIVDYGGIKVPYKWIAKKIFGKFDTEMVIFFVGSRSGNGWGFARPRKDD